MVNSSVEAGSLWNSNGVHAVKFEWLYLSAEDKEKNMRMLCERVF
jgi:hypothetical protein